MSEAFADRGELVLYAVSGKVSHERMVTLVHERYDEFDAKRRHAEAVRADVDDIAELEAIDKAKRGKDAA